MFRNRLKNLTDFCAKVKEIKGIMRVPGSEGFKSYDKQVARRKHQIPKSQMTNRKEIRSMKCPRSVVNQCFRFSNQNKYQSHMIASSW
jgi:hypothetical protein